MIKNEKRTNTLRISKDAVILFLKSLERAKFKNEYKNEFKDNNKNYTVD